jgi:predicted phosphatase
VHGELAALAWNTSQGTSIHALADLDMQKIPHYNVIMEETRMTDRPVPGTDR